MKRLLSMIICTTSIIILLVSCGIKPSEENSKTITTKEVTTQDSSFTEDKKKEIHETSPVTHTLLSRKDFLDIVKNEHNKFALTNQKTEKSFEEINYYFDFVILPDEVVFNGIIVDQYNMFLLYDFNGEEISLNWWRPKISDEYDHAETMYNLLSNAETSIINYEELKISRAYYEVSEERSLAMYSYHWQQDGENINLNVPASLIKKYGEELFVNIEKVDIKF